MSRRVRLTTARAVARLTASRPFGTSREVTLLRAIAWLSGSCSVTNELLPTVVAGNGLALAANRRPSRARCEVLPALPTLTLNGDRREADLLRQFRISPPEGRFLLGVAGWAKGHKVVEGISLSVRGEKAIRPFVMHGQVLGRVAASLADVMVTFARCASLGYPVCTSVLDIPAPPRWVIRARPYVRCTPHSETRAATEVVFHDSRRRLLKACLAGVAGYFYHASIIWL